MGVCQVEKVARGFQAGGMAGRTGAWLECGQEWGGPRATFLGKLRSRDAITCAEPPGWSERLERF